MEKSILQQILEERFDCYSYSGRAMYGETCLAVNDDGRGLGEVMATIIRGAIEEGSGAKIADAVSEMRTDSMGRGTVVYFPGVAFVEGA